MRLPPTLAGALAMALVLSACSNGGEGRTCGPITRESLDPDYLVHVLGDANLDYTTDPPTSGPHQPTPPMTGAVVERIARPVQIGILERGDVLIQYRPGLPADEVDALEELGRPRVVVAPNPELEDPVVATAWLFKRTCSGVDPAALDEFVSERVNHGPDG